MGERERKISKLGVILRNFRYESKDVVHSNKNSNVSEDNIPILNQ